MRVFGVLAFLEVPDHITTSDTVIKKYKLNVIIRTLARIHSTQRTSTNLTGSNSVCKNDTPPVHGESLQFSQFVIFCTENEQNLCCIHV